MALRPRRGAQVEYPRTVVLPVRPIGGMVTNVAAQDLPLEASPDMLNCFVNAGVLKKRPGYAQFGANSPDARINGLYATSSADGTMRLFAATAAKLFSYLSGTWTQITGSLTGIDGNLFAFETSENKLVFCQGVDAVQVCDLDGASFAALNANCPPAKYLTRFADRLVIGFTTESAVQCPFRIRRSIAGDHTDWTGVGSGFTDLSEHPYHIKQVMKLADMMAVYTEFSIWIANRTGIATAPYRFELRPTGIGLYAPWTLQDFRGNQLFLGNDDVYMFNGTTVQGLSQPVRDSVFNSLNAAALDQMFGQIRFDSQEYLLFLCTGAAATPNVVWAYNWGYKIFYPWSISGPCCSTIFKVDNTYTIDALPGTIDGLSWAYDARELQQLYPSLLTGNTDGIVYSWSTAYASDDGVAFPAYWSSKDFTARDLGAPANSQITLRRLGFTYERTGTGADLGFYFSVDGGSTWDGPYNYAMETGVGGWRDGFIDRFVTGSHIRFKFEMASATDTFRIAEFRPEFEVKGSERTS